jgi:hypothetical protein
VYSAPICTVCWAVARRNITVLIYGCAFLLSFKNWTVLNVMFWDLGRRKESCRGLQIKRRRHCSKLKFSDQFICQRIECASNAVLLHQCTEWKKKSKCKSAVWNEVYVCIYVFVYARRAYVYSDYVSTYAHVCIYAYSYVVVYVDVGLYTHRTKIVLTYRESKNEL